MKKTTSTTIRVLSACLSVLMVLSTVAFAAPLATPEEMLFTESTAISSETPVTAVAYEGFVYYTANWNGLRMYNVATGEVSVIKSDRTPPDARCSILINGTDLYVAFFRNSEGVNFNRVERYDLTDPANPVLTAVFVGPANGDGSYGAVPGNQIYNIGISGNTLYAGGESTGNHAEWDITATPVGEEKYVPATSTPEGVGSDTNLLYGTDEHLYILDAGRKLRHYNGGSNTLMDSDNTYSVYKNGDYMYFLKDNALHVAEETDLYSGSATSEALYDSAVTSVAISGVDEAYVMSIPVLWGDYLFYAADKLLCFDVSDPSVPVQVTIPDIATSAPRAFAIEGDTLYHAHNGGLQKIDLAIASLTIASSDSVASTPFVIEGTCSAGEKVVLSIKSASMPQAFMTEATVTGNTWSYELDDIYNGVYTLDVDLLDANDDELLTLSQTLNVTGGEGTDGTYTEADNTAVNPEDATEILVDGIPVSATKVASVSGKIPMDERIGFKEVSVVITDANGTSVGTGLQKSLGQFAFSIQLPNETAEGAEFTASVTCDGYLTPVTKNFQYFSPGFQTTAYAAISGKSDVADIASAIATYNAVYQLDVEGDYAALRSPEKALEALLGNTYTEPTALRNDFNTAVAEQVAIDAILTEIEAAATDALALQVLTNETDGAAKQATLGVDLTIAPFASLSNGAKAGLFGKIRAVEDLKCADVVEILSSDNCILLLVNTSADAALEEAITSYYIELGITEANINKYNDDLNTTQKNKVLRAVMRNSKEEYFLTLTAAGDKFETSLPTDGGGDGGGSSTEVTGPTEEQTKGDKAPTTSILGNTETPDVAIKSVFSDIKEAAWAEKYIMYLYNNQIVNGKSKDKFAPNDNITREEFVKIIVMAIGEKGEMGETEFTDVDSNAWYAPYLNTAIRLGIIKGVDEDTFGIGSEITREQMAVIIHRAAAVKNKKFSTTTEKTFADSVADYATEAVDALSGAGIINGYEDGTFRGNKTATRAESAKIIYGYLMMK